MNWIILFIAGLFEIGFTFCMGKMKGAEGHSFLLWLFGFIASLLISMYLMFRAAQTLPIGTAYAVWTGIGAAGTVLLGIIVFKEPVTFWRIFFISTLIASIIGLKFMSSSH